MITGTLLSGMIAGGLVARAVFVVAQGVGVLATHLADYRTDRLAR